MEIPSEPKRRPARARRFMQFSVRGLLLLIAICSVWLGIAFHRAREQARRVAVIRSAGANVLYDYEADELNHSEDAVHSNVPRWLLNSLGLDFFHDVVKVAVYAEDTTDDLLRVVSELSTVRNLSFQGSSFSNEGLAYLSRLSNLEMLSFYVLEALDSEHDGPVVDDRALAALSGLHALTELHITAKRFTDAGLDHLKHLTNLKQLVLGDTEVTKNGAQKLSHALPGCTIYGFSGIWVTFSFGPYGASKSSLRE